VTLDDPALLELGRLAWAAITLERLVYMVSEKAAPGDPYCDESVSTRIKAALSKVADEVEDRELRGRATVWLLRAQRALDLRNTVLHGIPVTFAPYPGVTPVPESLGTFVHHFERLPKKRRKDEEPRRQTVHKMTAADLRRVTREIDGAAEGWLDVLFDLANALDDKRAAAEGTVPH
jgi:hypothetical protein